MRVSLPRISPWSLISLPVVSSKASSATILPPVLVSSCCCVSNFRLVADCICPLWLLTACVVRSAFFRERILPPVLLRFWLVSVVSPCASIRPAVLSISPASSVRSLPLRIPRFSPLCALVSFWPWVLSDRVVPDFNRPPVLSTVPDVTVSCLSASTDP